MKNNKSRFGLSFRTNYAIKVSFTIGKKSFRIFFCANHRRFFSRTTWYPGEPCGSGLTVFEELSYRLSRAGRLKWNFFSRISVKRSFRARRFTECLACEMDVVMDRMRIVSSYVCHKGHRVIKSHREKTKTKNPFHSFEVNFLRNNSARTTIPIHKSEIDYRITHRENREKLIS